MVDAEMQDLINAIDGFLDKKGVELESKFHISKLMSEQYWDDFINDDVGEEVEEVDDGFEAEPEPEPEDDFDVPNSIPELDIPKKTPVKTVAKVGNGTRLRKMKPRLK